MIKIAFILNPVSGTRHKELILSYIKELFTEERGYSTTYYRTKCVGDAFNVSKEFAKDGYDIVVAIGGDGTVSEVAEGLINSDTKLAIIPVGSGNGLARHLKIPMSYEKAVEVILNGKVQKIDAGVINNQPFFCTAGLGFEAVIGDRFNSSHTRGLITYIEFCAKEYVKYRPERYSIDIEGKKFSTEAFLITFANCAQWGNNVFIAPQANISDGLLDVVVWKKTPAVAMPIVTAGLFFKTIQYSEMVDIYRCSNIHIVRDGEGLIQFDGESQMMGRELTISVMKNAVNVIVPHNWSLFYNFDDISTIYKRVPIIKDILK